MGCEIFVARAMLDFVLVFDTLNMESRYKFMWTLSFCIEFKKSSISLCASIMKKRGMRTKKTQTPNTFHIRENRSKCNYFSF